MDELISILISGTHEEFCKNIVVFLEIVSIHFEITRLITCKKENVKFASLVKINLY